MLLSVLETPNGKDKRLNRMTGGPKLELSKIGVTHVLKEKSCGPKENGHTFRGADVAFSRDSYRYFRIR